METLINATATLASIMSSLCAKGDVICTICIKYLWDMSHITGVSYGNLNVLFFIIVNPLTTASYGLAYLAERFSFRKTGLVLFIATTVVIVALIAFFLYILYVIQQNG